MIYILLLSHYMSEYFRMRNFLFHGNFWPSLNVFDVIQGSFFNNSFYNFLKNKNKKKSKENIFGPNLH
jgi:hypothetical protein